MTLAPYLRVLALPGVRSFTLLMLFARIPMAASGITLTLHVVLTLDRGYAEAGLVGALSTLGIAVGAPLLGRLADRHGLRRLLLITLVGETAFWLAGPLLPYPVLLAVAFFGGLVTLPVNSIGRQGLAGLVPATDRRTAFSMDSMGVEVSYMAGPALGVLVVTQLSSTAALLGIGGSLALVGLVLFVVNPPLRGEHELGDPAPAADTPTGRLGWLSGGMIAVLVSAVGATFVLTGTEVATVAALREAGDVDWTGLVVICMCLASLVGGFLYGAQPRAVPPAVLVGLLGLLLVPVALVSGHWWVYALALMPTNLMCAPAIAATSEAVTRYAPVAVRGMAMGLQSSALTLGTAIGSPLIGAIVDHTGPAAGFAVAGTCGVALAAVALLLTRWQARTSADVRMPA
ncbi:MFS transporter [Goodfellowiella coeruleoviolacea]|uniref:Arabinose efflux permease, MFS family n=1 Tax=Goodfellowiella coeruleoviolacea TaxID=334858 RepID=A0AAE3KFM5_9PSEU|nr:MFS transporter [Goodfellowiella coeruleoviolacea]MCP2164569.1 putative arabinose efflux permease, MFS family [Goodfellowiella coeruleoviolacea]